MRYLLAVLTLWSCVAAAGQKIEVDGHGANFNEAKLNGFQTAIEFVVGQVLVADTEVNGDQITKEFIGSYSAGYIEGYEILNTYQAGGKVMVSMRVAVATSKIAQRMMSSSNHRIVLIGQQLQDQLDSVVDQRQRGDRILSEVLTSYPNNAFTVNLGKVGLAVNEVRQPIIEATYEIKWNQAWLESLIETLDVVAVDSRSCNSWFAKWDKKIELGYTQGLIGRMRDTPCGQEADMQVTYRQPKSWLSTTKSFYFPDLNTLDVIKSNLMNTAGQHIGVSVLLIDAGGGVLDRRCANIDSYDLIRYHEPKFEVINRAQVQKHVKPRILGLGSIQGNLAIHPRGINLASVARIDISVVKTCN